MTTPTPSEVLADELDQEARSWEGTRHTVTGPYLANLLRRAAATLRARPPEGMVLVREDVVRFLLGESALDGYWFGEMAITLPPFWWRKRIRETVAAASSGGKEG